MLLHQAHSVHIYYTRGIIIKCEQCGKEHDKIRDSYLESAGFKVYRIKYKDPRNSLIVKEDIDKFLSWYKEYRDVG